MTLRLVHAALACFALACVARAPAPVREPPTPSVTEDPPRCRRLSSDDPALDGDGRLHVQSPAPLGCPAIVDPRGELIAVCAGGGVAVIDLDSGRELVHVGPVRAGAWGWDASGGLLVARDREHHVEIDRIDPRALEPGPERRASLELTGSQAQTAGLTRHGEVAIWLRHPLPELDGWFRRDTTTPSNALYFRGLDESATHELDLREPTELLWSIDGRSYAYVVDGEHRVTDAANETVLARWTGGLLDIGYRRLELPMTGGRGGDSKYGRERRAIVGLGRARMVHHDANGRLWVSSRDGDGAFERRRALDEIPRHAWFEGFSPSEDVAAFRVAHEQDDDELLLVDLETGALLAARSFPESIGSATVVDPRCGVLVIAAGDPIWWPTDTADAPTRRLGLPRTHYPTNHVPPQLLQPPDQVASPTLSFDHHACVATLEREGQAPVTLRWPAAPDGSAATYCSDVLINPARTRALLMTRDPPGKLDRYDLPMYRPWKRLRASMFALDGRHPERALWTRTLPEAITAVNFANGELLVASGTQHSTIVRLSTNKGRELGRTALPELAAIVAFVQVNDGFVAVLNDPYTRWWESDDARHSGIFGVLGPERSKPLTLRGFDEHWTLRWSTSITLRSWHSVDGWFPILDRSGTCLEVDAQGRYLIFDEHAGSTLAEIDEHGIRWIELPTQFELTPDRRALVGQNPAGMIELRNVSGELELLWQLAAYADGSWIRWREGEVLEHSPGEAYRAALNRIGAEP